MFLKPRTISFTSPISQARAGVEKLMWDFTIHQFFNDRSIYLERGTNVEGDFNVRRGGRTAGNETRDPPWLHLLPFEHDALSQRDKHYPINQRKVTLIGPLPRTLRTLRSIYHQLPRSMPSSLFQCIYTLELRNIHFQRFDDLAHLIFELRSPPRKIVGTRLTWNAPPSSVQGSQNRKPVFNSVEDELYYIWFNDCTQNTAALYLGCYAVRLKTAQDKDRPMSCGRLTDIDRNCFYAAVTTLGSNLDQDVVKSLSISLKAEVKNPHL